MGFGHLPYAIMQYLDSKKNLGLHTQLITDGLLPLFEKNVITNKKKTLLPGRVVASLCMGSKKLYEYVDNNPAFYFRSSEFVNDPTIIARNDNLVSISSALEVDLTGQICSDSMGYLFYSGIGDQVDFLRGSAMSKGGFSIVALPSTAQNGSVSRIVSHLSEGAGVATTRGDVNFVITEYGIAELQGKSIYQRVMELAQIAHPKFRVQLIDVAIATTNTSADSIDGSAKVTLGLDDKCADGGGAQLVTMGGVKLAAAMEAYGAQILALKDVIFAAEANGVEGISIVAGGEIDSTSGIQMAFCNGAGMGNNFLADYFRMAT